MIILSVAVLSLVIVAVHSKWKDFNMSMRYFNLPNKLRLRSIDIWKKIPIILDERLVLASSRVPAGRISSQSRHPAYVQ